VIREEEELTFWVVDGVFFQLFDLLLLRGLLHNFSLEFGLLLLKSKLFGCTSTGFKIAGVVFIKRVRIVPPFIVPADCL